MSDENGGNPKDRGNPEDRTDIRSVDKLGIPDHLQMGRLFYHFRSTPNPSLSRERVIVPQLDWDEVRNEMDRLTLENQRLKDIIISMHLNPPTAASFHSYQSHASSSSRSGQNLEIITGAGRLSSISSGPSHGSDILRDGSVGDDSASISSLPSDQTTDTEGRGVTIPVESNSEEPLDCVGFETPSEISIADDASSENNATLDSEYESSSGCSTIRIVEVEDDSSDSEYVGAEDQSLSVSNYLDSGNDIHIAEVSESEPEPEYYKGPESFNNSLDDRHAIISVEQEGAASNFWVNQRDNARSSGRLNYDVPDDFDPDQDDVLSDVETVQSDQALTAWGIEGSTASEEIQVLPGKAKYETKSSDDEEGWKEVPRKVNSTPNLRLYNFQTLPSPTVSGNISRLIGNIKTESGDPKKDDTSTIHGDHSSNNTIKTSMNSKPHGTTRTTKETNCDETLVDRLEGKKTEVDLRDERPQDKQRNPQASIATSILREMEEASYVARRKDPIIASANRTGIESSIFPLSNPFPNPLTPQNLDTCGDSMTPLIPRALTTPVGRIVQSEKSIEWMYPKPTCGGGSVRIQSPGEKNTLEASDTTEREIKAVNEQRNDPIRVQGEKEVQFQTWKENQSKFNTSSRIEHNIGKTQPTGPKSSLGVRSQKILAENAQTPVIEKSSPSIPPTVNIPAAAAQATATKTSQNIAIKMPKASHKAPSSSLHRNRSPKKTAPPKVIPSKAPGRCEEPELHHKRSIRFCDVLGSSAARPESQPTKVDINKPLVSILKSSTPAEPLTPLSDNTRIYNYEYIREVIVRDLPKDITLSGLLSQVRGGLIEKVLIDSHDLSARLVFAEPEAARRFYNHIHRTGFFVHTEITVTETSMKEKPVQCTLRGFIWTNHSCEIPVHMIQNIWKLNATRCLIINNFPKDIGIMRFIEDVLKLLNLPAVEGKYIIERTSTDRDSSNTNVLVRVGFSCIQYAFRVSKDLSTYSPLYSSVSVLYDKDPCGGLISNEPPACWEGGKEIGNNKPVVPLPAIKPQLPAKNLTPPLRTAVTNRTTITKKPVANVRANMVALWNQFENKSQSAPIAKAPVNPPVMASAPPVADISIAFKGFPVDAPRKRTRKSPGESNPSISAPVTASTPRAEVEKNYIQDQNTSSPAVLGQTIYDNWGVGISQKISQPPLGAHWNYQGQQTLREYNEAITKNIRRMPEAPSSSDEKPKIENLKSDHPLIDRVVHLKNLPRNFHVARLFRFIRGGMVEHVELRPPNSEYNTSSAIIVFVDQNSVTSYKGYLNSPGLTVEKDQRVVFAENITPETVANIRSLSHNHYRTRCLHIESLPKDTMLGEFLGIIEASMNHSNLEFEHVTVRESNGCSEAFLRLLTIGTAAFVAQVLERSYSGITITYDRDPCEGPVEELDEVNLELR